MRNTTQQPDNRPHGFTLVELLVVIAVIGLLISMLLPALGAVRESAAAATCASRMRQCGLAMQTYAESHGGYLPKVTGHGLDADESWIAKLGPYLDEVDVIRICPSDPEANYRIQNDLTSYVLNGFCARVDDEHDEDHEDDDHEDEDHEDEDHEDEHHDHEEHSELAGKYANLHRLASASSTILLFEAANGAHGDHVDSWDWFSEEAHEDHDHEHDDHHELFEEISDEIAIDRHSNTANYLYADGHVDRLDSEQIQAWCHDGNEAANFARPY